MATASSRLRFLRSLKRLNWRFSSGIERECEELRKSMRARFIFQWSIGLVRVVGVDGWTVRLSLMRGTRVRPLSMSTVEVGVTCFIDGCCSSSSAMVLFLGDVWF